MLNFCNGELGETALLKTLVCRVGLHWFANVLFCVVGFVFAHWEKKQNKFPSNCTALSTELQSNQSVFCNYFNLFIFHKCILVRFFTLAVNGTNMRS